RCIALGGQFRFMGALERRWWHAQPKLSRADGTQPPPLNLEPRPPSSCGALLEVGPAANADLQSRPTAYSGTSQERTSSRSSAVAQCSSAVTTPGSCCPM